MMKFKQTRKQKKQTGKSYPGMWQYPKNHDLCCIYRVPNSIRDVNPEAYTPQLVIIGPLHRSLISQARRSLDRGDDITYTKSMGYLNMEEHKKKYLAGFAQRFEERNIIDELRRTIKKDEKTIRASYSESTAWIQSAEFVEMVLHDSVFIIEFILKIVQTFPKKIGDPLTDELCLQNAVRYDLILLENQLPCFILEKLTTRICGNPNVFRELIILYFGMHGKIRNDSKFRHITDMFRCVHVETLPELNEGNCKFVDHMYNADKLDSGGVKFKAVGEEFSLNVTFENGCLKMPCLTVYDSLEMMLRNIIALEQCHYPSNAHVCNYIHFLDLLIDTEKDVDLLVEKGIIRNLIGQPALVAQMVNKLALGIYGSNSYCYNVAVEVNAYYSNSVNRSKAILKRVYFGNLWTGTATIAAIFLLVMTLIQTVASIIQVIQGSS